jgi:hypothetical protein
MYKYISDTLRICSSIADVIQLKVDPTGSVKRFGGMYDICSIELVAVVIYPYNSVNTMMYHKLFQRTRLLQYHTDIARGL